MIFFVLFRFLALFSQLLFVLIKLVFLQIENKELHDLLAISKNMLKPQQEEAKQPDTGPNLNVIDKEWWRLKA